jgi:exosome complex RNA-binding protein Csl4
MSNQNIMTAQLSIPAENLGVVAALVAKLGGELIVDDEVMTVPPLRWIAAQRPRGLRSQ